MSELTEENYSLDEMERRLQNTLFGGGGILKDNSYLHRRDIKLLITELEIALGVISMLEHHWISPMEYYEAEEGWRKRAERLDRLDREGILRLANYIERNLVPSPWRDTGTRLRAIGKQLEALATEHDPSKPTTQQKPNEEAMEEA